MSVAGRCVEVVEARMSVVAIFGFGFHLNGREDVSEGFIEQGHVWSDWELADSPALYNLLRSFKIGDIIYLKTHPPGNQLTIRAIGLVRDLPPQHGPRTPIGVAWLWTGPEIRINLPDPYNVRNNVVYEEWNPGVQRQVVELATGQHNAASATS
jgi:hypothetical protein